MLSRFRLWIDERLPLSNLIRFALDEEITGGSNYAYVFGSMLLFVFVIQAATGIWQLFYYVPTVAHAYDSVSYLRTEIPFGWLIHGLHYWGANAMIILLLCHIIRVFTWGAYKRPRELTWLAGVGLFFVTLAMSFTGAPLPWDERGYWATVVGTSIAGTVPFIGNVTKQLLRGGEAMGQLALSRMFILHIAIIPGTLLSLVGIHLLALRQFGSVGPWDEAKRARKGQFWPDQIFKDTLACTILLLILIALVVFAPLPFAGPADPLDTTYIPKPEWNFLSLYELLQFFPGKLEPIGTIGIPVIGILALLGLPFLDRKSERDPRRRLIAMTLGSLVIIVLIVLTITGHYSKPGADLASTKLPAGVTTVLPKKVPPGRALFQSLGCNGCHKIDGNGGSVGPDLSGEGRKGRSREWLVTQIKNPKTNNPRSIMPAFSTMTEQKVGQLVEYLQSLTGETTQVHFGIPPHIASLATSVSVTPVVQAPGKAAFTIGSVAHGKILFKMNCITCHGSNGSGHVADLGTAAGMVPAINPIDRKLYNGNPQLFAENIDLIIQHGSVPAGLHPALSMPAFGDTHALTQAEISDLEAYILDMNGVNRGGIMHTGIQPLTFLLCSTGAFILLVIIAFGRFNLLGLRKL